MAQHVLRDLVLELRDEQRTLRPRPDDGHVALEDVPQLRQLVDVRSAQQLADRRPPRILLAREHRTRLGFRILVHRSELVNHERLAVEAHPLLAVEHLAARRQLHQHGDDPERDGEHDQRGARDRDVDTALDDAVEALQRDVVDVDDRNAVEILEARAQRDHLQQIRHHLHVHALAARALDQLQHLDVLLRRQRDVEVVDPFAGRDFGRLLRRPEQRQAAVPEVIAGGAIVHEADDLIAELAVLEDLVGDEAPELAGAGDENALQADARAPPPLEQLAHELARREGERDVQHEEDAPHRLRHLERAARFRRGRREIRLHVQRGTTARIVPTNTAKKSSTRERPRRSR